MRSMIHDNSLLLSSLMTSITVNVQLFYRQVSGAVVGSSETTTVTIEAEQHEVIETTEVETTVDSLDDTATESIADTLAESIADSGTLAQTDVSAATLTESVSQSTPAAVTESVVEEVTEVVAETTPVKEATETPSEPVEDKVSELVHSEPRLRAKSRTSSKSRQSSETSTHEDINVDDEVPPKSSKVLSPIRCEKPTSQVWFTIVVRLFLQGCLVISTCYYCMDMFFFVFYCLFGSLAYLPKFKVHLTDV